MENRILHEAAILQYAEQGHPSVLTDKDAIIELIFHYPLEYEASNIPLMDLAENKRLARVRLENMDSPLKSEWLIEHGIRLNSDQEEMYALDYIQNMQAMKQIQRLESNGELEPRIANALRAQTDVAFFSLERAFERNVGTTNNFALSRAMMMRVRSVVEEAFR